MTIERRYHIPHIVALAAVIIGAFLVLWPHTWFDSILSRAAGLVVITIGLLATAVIPEYLTALVLFLAAMLLKVAPPGIIFSGFQSTAVWLVFSGLVIGVAITGTGLGKRIAVRLAGHLGGSYARIISGMIVVGVAFAFIMPSAMGRVALIVPITVALADHFGFKAGSNGRTGLILAALLGTFIPAFSILPANVPNMILAGMAESQLNTPLLYGEYLARHFPVFGILKAILIVAAIILIYPDQPSVTIQSTTDESGPMQPQEKWLTFVLAILLLLWMTDFIHHVSPAWIGLAGAVLLLLPRLGIVTAMQFNTKVNFGSIFFVAGVIGLGSIIKYSGLGAYIGKGLFAVLPLSPETPFIDYLSISIASTLTGLFATLPGVPAVIVPLSTELSVATGFPIKAVLMIQVIGFSTVFLPYQAPPIIVALQMSGESAQRIMKPLMVLAAVTYGVLVPLNYLWWSTMGWLYGT